VTVPAVNLTSNAAPKGTWEGATPVEGSVTIPQNLSLASHNEQEIYVEDAFWPRPDLDVTKWDKYCPYQLLVVQLKRDKTYKPYRDWQNTLPLPPESMTISTPFAVQGTVTLDGYVEEHNAAPIRHIVFRGSTGFLPSRSTGASRADTGALGKLEDQVTSIFAGTVGTARAAINSSIQAIASLTGSAPQAYNVHQTAEFSTDIEDNVLIRTSGFAQIALLRDFLESYVAFKKKNTEIAKSLRLAVAVWKENQVFLVTPLSFDVTKDISSPLEYKYSLAFKAFKRIKLEAGEFKDWWAPPIRQDRKSVV
jgi:hypothetical protein